MSEALLETTYPKDQNRLFGHRMTTYFQPICSIKTRSVIGLEALARGIDANGRPVSPLRLFEMAAREGLQTAMERHCRRTAVAAFAKDVLPGVAPLLFVNLSLDIDTSEDDVEAMLAVLRTSGVAPSSVVIEVLESHVPDTQWLTDCMKRFREHGFLLALDDVGSGHSNLDRVAMIRPDILKIDRELIRSIDTDHYKQGTFTSLASLSRRDGALLVAEGVETRGEAMTCLELGADLLQGFLLARPQPSENLAFSSCQEMIESVAVEFQEYRRAKIKQRRQEEDRCVELLQTVLDLLRGAASSQFDAVLRRAAELIPGLECCYVLNENGVQASDTVFRGGRRLTRNKTLFRPGELGTDHSLKDYFFLLRDTELSRVTTEPYVSVATGNICRTVSARFEDEKRCDSYIACVDLEAAG